MTEHSVDEFRALGHPVTRPSRQLDNFARPQHVTLVRFTSDELTAFCPVTHQPDFYTIELEYEPDGLCIESKSLKLFLWSYRDEHCFAEELASQIAEQVVDAIHPLRCRVTLHQNVRGGMKLSAVAEMGRG